MSAITAPSPVPASASAVAHIAAHGASEPPAPAAGPFDALFQRLMVQQFAAGADTSPPLPFAPASEADTTAAELSALLPFLDAMGLTQTDATPATAASQAETAPADAALAILAGPASIPVANSPAISAALPNLATEHAKTSADTTNPTLSADPTLSTASGDSSQNRELPEGREFSSQLVAALAASKEQAHSPGSSAAAVQQVIANASPAQQAARSSASPSLPIAQPVGAAGWSEEIGNRVVWMANRMESRADLVLTPPQMGRIEVSLSMSGDQATASFVSGNPAVREALEAALPRLREVLADAGVQLGQTQVSSENARQSAQQDKNSDNFGFNRASPPDNATFAASSGALPATAGLKAGRGLVDIFA